MIGSLFRLGMLATLVGGSTFALVGPDRVKMYFENGKDSVLSAIDNAQGMETKLDLIRSQIRGLDSEVRDLKEEAIRRKVEVNRMGGDVAEREDELGRQERMLAKASGMLSDGSDFYVIGGMRYSRATVEQDARDKLAMFQVQSDTLHNLRETMATKRNALLLAEQNVERAATLRSELEGKIGLLEAKLQKFRAQQHFAATASGELIDTGELDSDLARAREMITSFEEDLEVKALLLQEQLKAGADQPSDGIDYEAAEAAEGADDLVGQIDQVLLRVRGVRGGADVAVSVGR